MVIFRDEKDLVMTLENNIALVKRTINGEIDQAHFIEEHTGFYYAYALDGHESDEEEKLLFEKYYKEIDFFKDVQETILNNICSDEESTKEIYIVNGRINVKEAINRLKEKYFQTFEMS
jgi:hypothetical protein